MRNRHSGPPQADPESRIFKQRFEAKPRWIPGSRQSAPRNDGAGVIALGCPGRAVDRYAQNF
jgi:hypothetical protein